MGSAMAFFVSLHCNCHGHSLVHRCDIIFSVLFQSQCTQTNVASLPMSLDTFLYTLVVPILPYMLESRLGLDSSLLQTMSFWLLAETAAISVLLSIPIGYYADRIGTKRLWLLWALAIALVSTLGVALATSSMCSCLWYIILYSVIDCCCSIRALCKPARASHCKHHYLGCGICNHCG